MPDPWKDEADLNIDFAFPTQKELEDLFVNNRDLQRVGAYLNRFNPIRTMRMEGMEIRHSSILAWLLDPRETHGLGDKFLRAFLCEAMRGQSGLGSPTALEIAQADLRDAEVRREWQQIDIFILLPRLNWAFVIENKFNSSQHEGQLAKYAQRVKSIFEPQEGALKVRGVFLTLYDEVPQDENFVPIQYSAICEILPSLIEDDAKIVNSDVSIFIRHYIEIIQEAAGMNEERNEMEALARQLYRSHKKVLDFVMDYGATTDFILAMEATLGEGLDYGDAFEVDGQKFVFNGHSNLQVSFLPSGWIESLGDELNWSGCENWWAGYPLICWLQLHDDQEGTSGRLRLYAEVGPISDYDFRKSLIEKIADAAQLQGLRSVSFQKTAMDEGKKFSKFLKGNEAHVSDTQNIEEIEKAMRSLLKKFESVFQVVGNVLPEFKRFGYLSPLENAAATLAKE
ncbi:unnamed protein product [Ciceribacter sp. T2.26MG-112.2]|nr:unnamed protein product [Ciceribacter naphthalenivorans]